MQGIRKEEGTGIDKTLKNAKCKSQNKLLLKCCEISCFFPSFCYEYFKKSDNLNEYKVFVRLTIGTFEKNEKFK